MAQENVELLQGLFGAAADLDKAALVAALPQMIPQICDPDIEWIEDPKRADGRIYRGHDGVLESFERWLEDFDEYSFEMDAIEDHGEQVLVTAVEHGRGSASGADVSAQLYMLCTFSDSRILRYQEFYDESDARAALAL